MRKRRSHNHHKIIEGFAVEFELQLGRCRFDMLRKAIWESESKRDHRDTLAEEHTPEISQIQVKATHLRSVTFLTPSDPNRTIFCCKVTQLLRSRTAQVTLTSSVGEDE
jgi:hypothetical protein